MNLGIDCLKPRDVCISSLQFSHFGNTYNKRKLLLESVIRREGLSPISSTEPTDKVLTDILKDTEFIEAMRAVSSPTYTEEPEYDIVYYCGFFQPDWNPEDKALGGSEQAVVHLSEEWARKGKKVAVYAALTSKTKLTVNGVDYFPAYLFPFAQKQRTLILWRISGCFRLAMDLPIKAERVLCDFHDNFDGSARFLPKYLNKVDKVMFKSDFHADCFDQIVTKLPAEKRCVVMNGVRVEEFESRVSDPPRDPYRFVYASSYDRGLLWMIHGLWKHIQEMEPRAELHVYYGIHSMPDSEQRKMLLDAFAGMNIMDHGRQPLEIIRREKYRAAFHLYPTVSAAETDCITIRESLITGCVPILSNVGVMKERDGFHIDFDIRDPETLKKPAADIVELMRNGSRMEALRKELAESKTIVNWETVAQRWMELFTA
jgi:glycosyltransferase involved in cell wall biosynthesis